MDRLKLGRASMVIGLTGTVAALIGGLTYGEIKDTPAIEQIDGRVGLFSLTEYYTELADIERHNLSVYETRLEFVLLVGGLSSAFLLTGLVLNEKYV